LRQPAAHRIRHLLATDRHAHHFCTDPLHLDLEVAFGHELLQPRVLRLELLQPPSSGWNEPNRFFYL
jgi:hypothetical protein